MLLYAERGQVATAVKTLLPWDQANKNNIGRWSAFRRTKTRKSLSLYTVLVLLRPVGNSQFGERANEAPRGRTCFRSRKVKVQRHRKHSCAVSTASKSPPGSWLVTAFDRGKDKVSQTRTAAEGPLLWQLRDNLFSSRACPLWGPTC